MRIASLILSILILSAAVPALAFDVITAPEEYDGFCPQLSLSMARGADDAHYYGQVTELQKFYAGYFELPMSEIVSGTFGANTELYTQRFQAEHGLEIVGRAGPQTLEAIAKICPVTATDLPTSPIPYAPIPEDTSVGSCTLRTDKTSASDKERFAISWKIVGINSPVLWREGNPKDAISVPAEASKQWVVGTDVASPGIEPRLETFHIGHKAQSGGTPLPKCSISVRVYTKTGSGSFTLPTAPAGASLPNLVLALVPPSVPRGQSSALQWTTANTVPTATRCFLEYDGKKLEFKHSGSRNVRPVVDTTYTMTCLNTDNGFSVKKSVRLTLTEPRPQVAVPTPNDPVGGGNEGGMWGSFFGGGNGFGFGGFNIFGQAQSLWNNVFGNTCLSITGDCGGSGQRPSGI